MPATEFELYTLLSTSEEFNNTSSSCVDAVVYLDVAPGDCLHRVRNMRKTESEQEIPLAYFQGLDDM